MKKLIIGFAFAFAIMATFSFAKSIYEVKDVTGEVKKTEGVPIFEYCLPVKEYQNLGKVKLSYFSAVGDLSGEKMVRSKLIKKAKEAYPDFSALIYDRDDESAEVIKFK